MNPIRVYTNFKTIRGPFGGANSFMRSMIEELENKGYKFSTDINKSHDLAFINALSDGVEISDLKALSDYGIPIIHRKVGYTVSGGPDMREKVHGVPRGERNQLEFDSYVAITVFQSEWSQQEFLRAGFQGKSVVIRNGVSSKIFHPYIKSGIGPWSKKSIRPPWVEGERFRIAICSWSTDLNKGFSEYLRLDNELSDHSSYEVRFFGRMPESLCFKNIRTFGALPHSQLAEQMRQCHSILTLSKNETCSNSLIEAISCGLPAVYLDSGSNRELAATFGVEYRGDYWAAFEELRREYTKLFNRVILHPFQIESVADSYQKLFREALEP